jgi:acyl carrier protein
MGFKKEHTGEEIYNAMKEQLLGMVDEFTDKPEELDLEATKRIISRINGLAWFLLGINANLDEENDSALANLAWDSLHYVETVMKLREKALECECNVTTFNSEEIRNLELFVKKVTFSKYISETPSPT